MVKLAKAGKNQGESKKMAPPPKEVEEDNEDEEMSDKEDESSGEEVIIPQIKVKKATTPGKKVMVSPTKKIAVATPGKKAAVTPAKSLATPGKTGGTPGKSLVATPVKGAATPAKGAKNTKKEDSDEDNDDSEEEEHDEEDEDEFEPAVMKAAAAAVTASDDEDDDEEDDSEEEPMEIAPAKGKKAPIKAIPVKAKSTALEDEDEEDEEEEEEEPVREAPGKGKKKMAKQKAAPEAKKQKVEATEPTTAFNLFVGNLNSSKSAPELKTGISDVFAKNDLAVVDVRIGVSRKFGYVDFESAEDLEKALELTGLKVFGNEIKLEKPKGKDSKKGALFDMATKKKQRKTEDENRVFKVEWTETFAFIQNLNGLPTCLICQEKLAHNKKSNLERHFTTKHESFSTKYPVGDARKKAVEELQKSQENSSSVFNYWMQSSSNVDIASFVVSQEIAKRGKPYTDGEYIKSCFINASKELFRDFKNKADILKKIKELPLSAKTVKDGTVKMSSNLTDQRVEDLKLVSALSIAVSVSCDINDTAQVSLFVRFISSTGPKEDLLGLLPLKGQTRGEDIANAVIECIEKHHIPFDKIVSISTDGAKSMTGLRNGFVAILKEKINHEILTYHCIIHQEALCAQTFPEEICKVMELVINIINSIIAKALNHRQFKELLVEIESEYADLLLHNKVRWLSRGNVLKRFASLLTEIKAFLLEKGVHYPELWNDQWIQKFYFMVDVTSHLNQLNRKLQGKGNTVFSMLEEVISFENKLSLLAQDFERETLIHFPSLLKHCQENNSYIDIWYFQTTLLNMREAFLNRFQDIRSSKATLGFVKKPLNATVTELNFSPFNIDIADFEMQLLDLKHKELWSSKFERLCADLEILEKNKCELSSQHKWSALKDLEKEDMLIFNTWNSIPNSYNQLKKLAFAVLSLFGSTYLCEQSFLESCLKLKTTYKPDLLKLSKEMQGYCSH